MSKAEGKRGFAPSQPQTAAPSTEAWEAAKARVVEANRALEAAPDRGNGPDPEHAEWHAARDAALGTPAPNGEALAYKIGLYGYPQITDNFDCAAGVFQPDRIAKIAREGTEDEKGLLALYLDALALSGAPAAPCPRAPYYTTPALQTYAATKRDAAVEAEGGGPKEERSDQAYRSLIATPALSVSDVIAKLAAYVVEHGGGGAEADDPGLFESPAGMMLDGIEDLGQIGRDLIALANPPQASGDFYRLRDDVLELHGSDRDLTDAEVAAETALQEQFFKTPAPNASAVADKLRLGLDLDGYLTEVVEFAVADLDRIANQGRKGVLAASDPSGAALGQWFKTTWAWEMAVEAFKKAEARFVAVLAQVNAADEAAQEASIPPDELLREASGKTAIARHYLDEEEIITDTRLTLDERVAKVALFREWSALRAAAYERHGADRLAAELDAAGEVLSKAKDRLWKITPPDPEGLRLKMQIHIEDYQLHNLGGIDLDEEGLSCLLTSERQTDQEIGRLYRDLVSVADPGSPLARVTAFDALEWIEEFEKFPGHVVHEHGIGFVEPDAFPDGVFGDAPPPGRALLDALTDWQLKAVRRAGRHRDGVRRIVKDIVMTYANSWDTREEVEGFMETRHPKAAYEQMRDAWAQVDAMDDVAFGLSEEEANACAGKRWLVAWRFGGGSVWIDRENDDLAIGLPTDCLSAETRYMRDEIARLPELRRAVREALVAADHQPKEGA